MSRLVVALSLVVLVLGACAQAESSSAPPQPAVTAPSLPESPAAPVAEPSDAPSLSAPSPASPEPVATPQPTGTPPVVDVTAEEQALLGGVRRGAIDCH